MAERMERVDELKQCLAKISDVFDDFLLSLPEIQMLLEELNKEALQKMGMEWRYRKVRK